MFKWKVDLGRKIRLERGSCVLVNGIKGYFDGKKKKMLKTLLKIVYLSKLATSSI